MTTALTNISRPTYALTPPDVLSRTQLFIKIFEEEKKKAIQRITNVFKDCESESLKDFDQRTKDDTVTQKPHQKDKANPQFYDYVKNYRTGTVSKRTSDTRPNFNTGC